MSLSVDEVGTFLNAAGQTVELVGILWLGYSGLTSVNAALSKLDVAKDLLAEKAKRDKVLSANANQNDHWLKSEAARHGIRLMVWDDLTVTFQELQLAIAKDHDAGPLSSSQSAS